MLNSECNRQTFVRGVLQSNLIFVNIDDGESTF